MWSFPLGIYVSVCYLYFGKRIHVSVHVIILHNLQTENQIDKAVLLNNDIKYIHFEWTEIII